MRLGKRSWISTVTRKNPRRFRSLSILCEVEGSGNLTRKKAMEKIQKLIAETEQRIEHTQMEWWKETPDPLKPLAIGWTNFQLWALSGPQVSTLYQGPGAIARTNISDVIFTPIMYRSAYDLSGTTAAPASVWIEALPKDSLTEKAMELVEEASDQTLDFLHQHTGVPEKAMLASRTQLMQLPLERFALMEHKKGIAAITEAIRMSCEAMHEEAKEYCRKTDLRCGSFTGGWV